MDEELIYDEIIEAAIALRNAQPFVFVDVLGAVPQYSQTEQSNCWGFTAAAARWIAQPKWLWPSAIVQYLQEHTTPVDIPHIGDIIAFWQYYDASLYSQDAPYHILHTALYLGNNRIIHKPGRLSVEVAQIESAHKDYTDNMTYHRIIY